MDTVRSCHCHFPSTYLRSGVRGAGELCFEAWGAINHDLPVKTDGASIETFTDAMPRLPKRSLWISERNFIYIYYIMVLYITIIIIIIINIIIITIIIIIIIIYIYQYTSCFPQSPSRFDQYLDCTMSTCGMPRRTWRGETCHDLWPFWAKLEDTLPVFSSYHNFPFCFPIILPFSLSTMIWLSSFSI